MNSHARSNVFYVEVYTGESNTPDKAKVRYTDTFVHLVDWHMGNIFFHVPDRPWDKAYASVQAVRNLHAAIRKDMNSHSPGPIPDGATQWMSQYNVSHLTLLTACQHSLIAVWRMR